MAHTSMKRLGYVTEPFAREMVMLPSSSGWRIVSSTAGENSGSSSRKSTPLSARLISPGCSALPPPDMATFDTVWCGARNGRTRTTGSSGVVRPRTE